MSRLIEGAIGDGGSVVDDPWTTVDTCEALHLLPNDRAVLASHAVWASERDRLLARPGPLGIRLEPQDDPGSIAADLSRLSLVAVHFPKFTDGRGYSIARLLRERYGYRGRLRAVGDVLRDQLFYMLRCGFDSFEMKHLEQLDDALTAYRDFSDAYQTSVERTVPLFKRRGMAAA